MAVLRSLCTFALLALGPASAGAAQWPQNVDVDSFVATEMAIALQGALNNIGPNGSLVPGATAGYVVASPSKVNPNCMWFPTPRLFFFFFFFFWSLGLCVVFNGIAVCKHANLSCVWCCNRLLHLVQRLGPDAQDDH
jgi:hypothetical protein